MEIIVKETSKPQDEWDEDTLHKYNLKYNNCDYNSVTYVKNKGFYYYMDEYLEDLRQAGCLPASEYVEYRIFKGKEYFINGLKFGSIKWNLYSLQFQDNDEEDIKAISKISYDCFYGMTASQILHILILAEGVK